MGQEKVHIPDEAAFYSIHRALLGEVTASTRAISFENEPGLIKVWVYVEGPLDRDEIEDFDAGAMTQVVADFPDECVEGRLSVEFEFVRCDFPERIPMRGRLMFERK